MSRQERAFRRPALTHPPTGPIRLSARDNFLGLIASLVAVGACLWLLHKLNPRFFFVDDYTAEFYPKMRDIGRMLLEGRLPWQSDRLMVAGNYILEFQTAIFNPVKWAFAVLSQHFDDAVRFSFIYFSFFILAIAGCGYLIGALLGLAVWGRILAALLCALQPYTIYWQVGGWADPLSGYAGLVLAVASLLCFLRWPTPASMLFVMAGSYMALSSGWPPAIVAFLAFAVILGTTLLVQRSFRTGFSLLYATGCGLLAAAPAIVSFILTFGLVGDRENSIINEANFNVVTLQGLLQFSNVAYREFMNSWGGYRLQPQPHFYLAWFVMPVMFFVARLPTRGRTGALLVASMICSGLFGLLALGPERLTVFRFPSRNLQFYLFFLTVAALIAMSHGRFVFSRRRLAWLGFALALLSIGAMQSAVREAGLVLLAGFAWIAGSAALVYLWRQDGCLRALFAWPVGPFLVATTLVSVVALIFVYPKPRGHDWEIPAAAPTAGNLGLAANTLFFGGYVPPDAYAEFRPATTGAITGMAQFNGYTSIGHRGLNRYGINYLDQGNISWVKYRELIDNFLKVEPVTGRKVIDLLKIDRIIASKDYAKDWRAALERSAPEEWPGVEEKAHTGVFSRVAYALPGSLSYASPGLELPTSGRCVGVGRLECHVVANRNAREGLLVFARLWYPGSWALLGDRRVPAGNLGGLFVTVPVPAGYAGQVALEYRPPGLSVALGLSLLGFAGWLAYWLYERRRTRGAGDFEKTVPGPGNAPEEPTCQEPN